MKLIYTRIKTSDKWQSIQTSDDNKEIFQSKSESNNFVRIEYNTIWESLAIHVYCENTRSYFYLRDKSEFTDYVITINDKLKTIKLDLGFSRLTLNY